MKRIAGHCPRNGTGRGARYEDYGWCVSHTVHQYGMPCKMLIKQGGGGFIKTQEVPPSPRLRPGLRLSILCPREISECWRL